MRVIFIKNYTLPDGREIKPGEDITLWDATEVLKLKVAIPYGERRNEPQTEPKATPEGAGKDTEDPIKTKTKKIKTGGK